MQRIILITGPGRGKTHMAHLLQDNYKAQGIPCKLIHAMEVDLEEALEDLEDFHGYIIVDEPADGDLPEGFTPWQIITVNGGHGAEPGDGLQPLPGSQPAPFWLGAVGGSPSGETDCWARCSLLHNAVFALVEVLRPRHADAR